jgi:DNA-directed RNA polymerase subunit M/transcription elongation factor TFIIS
MDNRRIQVAVIENSLFRAELPIRHAYKLEIGAYNNAIITVREKCQKPSWGNDNFVNIYSSYCYKIVSAIDKTMDSYSPSFTKMLESASIDEAYLKNASLMTATEINPDANVEERDFIQLQGNQKIEKKYSKFQACPRCNQKTITFTSRQLRSSDEGTTECYECDNPGCKFKWKRN